MTNKQKIILSTCVVVFLVAFGGVVYYFMHSNVAVLNPRGEIALQERNLLIFTVILSLFVVLPVFTLLGFFAWRYRDTNTKRTKYMPDWDSDRTLETIWWSIPCVIILVLGVVTWQTSHQLDPFKSLDSSIKPLTVQVVALQWKWLFIYPEQHIASVNELIIPEKTPINFEITSDAPMNALWIPSLGGQIYAMSGMSTQLHLIADSTGEYQGSSSNISGTGFADMVFTTRSVTKNAFDDWAMGPMSMPMPMLDLAAYNALARPSTVKEPTMYMLQDQSLYDSIIMKYMQPMSSDSKSTMEGM